MKKIIFTLVLFFVANCLHGYRDYNNTLSFAASQMGASEPVSLVSSNYNLSQNFPRTNRNATVVIDSDNWG